MGWRQTRACLALAAAVGQYHAQEDSQHAAGLTDQHCGPQCQVLLHQARCGIHAAGAALGTWQTLQKSLRAALWGAKLHIWAYREQERGCD